MSFQCVFYSSRETKSKRIKRKKDSAEQIEIERKEEMKHSADEPHYTEKRGREILIEDEKDKDG